MNKMGYSIARINMLGNAHPNGLTRLKMWADKVLENTISNNYSDRFTRNFRLVVPLRLLQSKIQNPKSKIDRHITHPLLKLGKLSKILQKLLDRGEP
jgi:hypothetical protein